MYAEIKNAVNAAGEEAQYDEKAKRLLGNKTVLAHILIRTIDEFSGMDPEEAASHIEGEPLIGVVPVEPGLTNAARKKDGQRVVGMNTESAEVNEGLARFDIIFYVRMKDGISQVIVNVEAQKGDPQGYDIMNRAVFYVSRIISSQKERDFTGMDYNGIKRVFSIWICMNMEEDSMSHVHLVKEDLLGTYPWKGGLDLMNIVLIGLSEKLPEHDGRHDLHRLLGTILSMDMPASEKFGIMEQEYRIALDDRIREDVREMCNLSQGIMEKGIERGIERGMAKGRAEGKAEGRAEAEAEMILNMHRKGYTSGQIADITGKNIEEIESVIEEGEPVLA